MEKRQLKATEITINTLSTVAKAVEDSLKRQVPREFDIRLKKVEYNSPGSAKMTLVVNNPRDMFYLGLFAGMVNSKY
jgi:hypothetical protein